EFASLCLLLLGASVAMAQDGGTTADGATPAEQAAPAGAAPAADTGADPSAAPSGSTPASDTTAPSVSGTTGASAQDTGAQGSDGGSADAAANADAGSGDATASKGFFADRAWYAGADYVATTFTSSSSPGFAPGHYDSGMYRLRGGTRFFGFLGAELQYGLDAGGSDLSTENYMGVFAVPTTTVLETFELAFPVGYTMSKVSGGGSATLQGLGYGVAAELPLRTFGQSMPDLRFTAGWTVYYRGSDAQLYGGNVGLRYDFGGPREEPPAPAQ
ncbi:MAG TPA: hypothetical protein VM369_10930, partial [Candidatus Binatia bacterium]|nr:hypothetical protein [Candidatus Binatia bacterium]